jgi:hypothetical protein
LEVHGLVVESAADVCHGENGFVAKWGERDEAGAMCRLTL